MTTQRHRLFLGVVALCGLLLVPGVTRRAVRLVSGTKAEASTADSVIAPETIKWVWSAAVPGYRSAALSPDGKYVAVISHYAPGKPQERLSLWRWQDRPLTPLWVRAEPNASTVAVSADAQTILTCAHMNPAQRLVSFRRGADGARIGQYPVDGPIWDVQTSADGQYAALTTGGTATGGHGLYLFNLGDRPAPNRFPSLDGIGNSVALTANNTYLAAGTWDDSGVTCYTMNRTKVWQYPTPADSQHSQAPASRVFETKIAQGGHYVLGVSYANAHQSDGTLYLWRTDGDGSPRWVHELGVDTFFPKALITDDGQFVVVTYTRVITHGDQSISERRLLVLDGDGKPLWERGNLLFSPTLIALAPDGHRVTVSDGQKTLCNLDANGRVTKIYPIKGSATIRDTIPTPDGHDILVYTSDGQLNLFQIG